MIPPSNSVHNALVKSETKRKMSALWLLSPEKEVI